ARPPPFTPFGRGGRLSYSDDASGSGTTAGRSADSSKENWRDDFACVTRDGASIYLSERALGQSETWLWIGVEDVAALHDEYCQSGAVRVQQPTNFPWARCPPHALAPVLG